MRQVYLCGLCYVVHIERNVSQLREAFEYKKLKKTQLLHPPSIGSGGRGWGGGFFLEWDTY